MTAIVMPFSTKEPVFVRTLRLHYDGWLHLPEELARSLDRAGAVAIERRDGGLFIAPAPQAAPTIEPKPEALPAVVEPAPIDAVEPVKRGRGRPRKATVTEVAEPNPPEEAQPRSADAVPAHRRPRLPKALQPPSAARGRRARASGSSAQAND